MGSDPGGGFLRAWTLSTNRLNVCGICKEGFMNADQAKFLAEHYARVIENEIPTTAKVLAAVSRGNGDYKPDPKSRSAIELARHIATADGWFVQSVLDGKFEFDQAAAEKAEDSLTTAADAVSFYEQSMRDKV